MSETENAAPGTSDKVQIGLSSETHEQLRRLREDGVFNDMLDAYRLGIALAIARGVIAPPETSFGTIYQVSGVDPDGSLRNLIAGLYPELAETPSRAMERLAEVGVAELSQLHEGGQLLFSELFRSVRDSPVREGLSTESC